jgi:hypothetical protein
MLSARAAPPDRPFQHLHFAFDKAFDDSAAGELSGFAQMQNLPPADLDPQISS